MSQDYIPIATITVGTPVSSVSFSNIPATYTDLVLVMNAATSSNSNNTFRLNGDSSGSYTGLFMTGNGSSATQGPAGGTFLQTDSSAFTTTVVGETNHIIQFFDYARTNKHKTILVRANRASGAVDALAQRWANTSAITSMVFTPNSGPFNWVSGSRFDLYGIIA